MYFLKDSLSPSPSSFGATLQRICSLGEQILSFKSTPKFAVITVSTIKVNSKNVFLTVRGYGKL